MKTPALDLAPVTAGRENLASAESRLVAMRERLEVARQLVETREQEQQACEATRRQVVISGDDDEPAVRALVNARILSEDARERLALLTAAVREVEDEVIAAENALLLTLDAARLAQFETAKKSLSDSILKLGPGYQSAALGIGLAWPTVGKMLESLGDRDLGPYWQKTSPVEALRQGHKSATITEERRGPPR